MNAPRQPEDKLLVAIHNDVALVRVDGRGSFKVSTALKDFGNGAIEKGCKLAAVDMSACIGMDSTFMGVLAGLAVQLRDRAGGRLVLLNLSPRTRGLVATLGLDRIVEACESGRTPPEYASLIPAAPLTTLDTREETQFSTTETMIEAHENLVKVDEQNAPRFKDVLTFLREDLRRRTDGPADRR